jgi:hypothetical protein
MKPSQRPAGRITRSRPKATPADPIQISKSFLEKTLKKLSLIAIAIVCLSYANRALAQGFDVAFGLGTLHSAQTTFNTTTGFYYPSLRGGVYPGFSADFLLHRSFGIEGELFWRASQGVYGLQPYRPIFWNFNGIWVPKIDKHFSGEVLAGIGAEDIRFYGIINYSPFSGYTNYASSTHFQGDVGAGLRAYFWHGAFIRPEVRLYLINNNNEFSSDFVFRYGGSIGYSFGR